MFHCQVWFSDGFRWYIHIHPISWTIPWYRGRNPAPVGNHWELWNTVSFMGFYLRTNHLPSCSATFLTTIHRIKPCYPHEKPPCFLIVESPCSSARILRFNAITRWSLVDGETWTAPRGSTQREVNCWWNWDYSGKIMGISNGIMILSSCSFEQNIHLHQFTHDILGWFYLYNRIASNTVKHRTLITGLPNTLSFSPPELGRPRNWAARWRLREMKEPPGLGPLGPLATPRAYGA